MSRLLVFFGIALCLSVSTSSDVAAQRKGFIIGFGAGPGFTTGDFGEKVGVATDFEIGGMLDESLQLYFSAKSNLLFGDGGAETTGVIGIGAAYVLPAGFNINGLAGLAPWWHFDGGTNLGFGLGAGVGYEFTDNWVFNVGGTVGMFEGDMVFNIAATISILSH